MKRGIPLILLIATVSLCSCKGRGDTAVDTPEADTVVVEEVDTETDTVPRTSITFILGEDNSTYNQYYTLANHYYRLSPDDRTEVVVEGLTALSQVLDYLRKHPSDNGRPYGLINLVSHGNEFVDLTGRNAIQRLVDIACSYACQHHLLDILQFYLVVVQILAKGTIERGDLVCCRDTDGREDSTLA